MTSVRRLATTAGMAAAVTLPLLSDAYTTGIGVRVLALGLLAVAVHHLSASAHLASLGHAAFFGVGAYSTVILVGAGIDAAFVHLAAAAIGAALIATGTGIALIRLRGLTYVLATLAVGMLAATAATTATLITGGTDGRTTGPVTLWPETAPLTGTSQRYLWVLAATITACTLVARRARSPFGAAMTAIGDSEPRIRALGYPVESIVLRAHAFSGALAAVAGALWVHGTGYINPTDLGLATSAIALAAATISHRHGPTAVIAATAALILARDVAASHLPPAGQGPLWLGLLLLAAAFLPLAQTRPTYPGQP